MVTLTSTVAEFPCPSLRVMVVVPAVDPAVTVKDVPMLGATVAITVLALLALKSPEKPVSLAENVADCPDAANDSDDGEATTFGSGAGEELGLGVDVGACVEGELGVDGLGLGNRIGDSDALGSGLEALVLPPPLHPAKPSVPSAITASNPRHAAQTVGGLGSRIFRLEMGSSKRAGVPPDSAIKASASFLGIISEQK